LEPIFYKELIINDVKRRFNIEVGPSGVHGIVDMERLLMCHIVGVTRGRKRRPFWMANEASFEEYNGTFIGFPVEG